MNSVDDKVSVHEETYPNGQPYKVVKFGGEKIGGYDLRDDGYRPFGARKARLTEFEAIRDIIRGRLREVDKQGRWLDSALDQLYEQQFEFKEQQ